MKCPICKVKLTQDSYYDSDIHMTVEEYSTCADGCGKYSYEYAYGAWREKIGCREFQGYHSDSKTTRRRRNFVIKQTIYRLRKKMWSK